MPANELSLTFLLKADSSQAIAEMKRLRAQISSQLSDLNKPNDGAAAAAITAQRQQAKAVTQIQKEITAAVVSESRARTTATETAARGEFTVRQQLAAAASLQRQRSAALIAQWKQEEKAALQAATGTKSFRDVLQQLSASVATLQGPLGGVVGRISSFSTVVGSAGPGLSALGASAASAGSRVAAMAGPIGIAVAAVAALSLGAGVLAKELFDLSKQAADFQGRMFDLAQQTGLAVQSLSAFEVIAQTTGGSLDTIAQAVVLFQRKLDDAQDPLSKAAEQFRKFNIETTDTESALRQTFAALAAMPEGFSQTNAAAEFFGARGGKQVLAILKETSGDLDATIKRLRDLGILISDDAARAADRFNDELALLDFELRALGAAAAEDLIPAFTQMIRSLGEIITAARPLVSLFSSLAGPVARSVAEGFKGLSIIVQALTRDYQGLARSIKEAQDAQNIAPLSVPGVAPVPLPGAPTGQQTASDAVNQADAVLAAVKRKVAEQNQALDTLFQQGRRDRQQQALETIELNKQILQADKARIDALLAQKEQEIKALDQAQRNRGEIVNRDTEQYRAVTAQIVKLQQERLDKENLFEVTSREIRARARKERADAERNQIADERDRLLGEFDRTIKDIEAQIARGAKPEEDGLTVIEQIEQAKIETRLESLQKQKDVGFLTIQDQKDLDAEMQKLRQERDRLDDEQQARRLQRERNAAERTRDILLANIDTALQLEQIAGERRIATAQALADQRVITEENAAKRILKIRLDLLDDEIEATEAKLNAAKSIADNDERVRTQAELNNQLKIFKAQRVSIETDGNRAIDDARQKDLENERRYAEELKEISERIIDIQRDTQQQAIRLMVLDGSSLKAIIRSRVALELAEEADRHRRATDSIKAQQSEVDEQIRILESHLKSLKIGTDEEIEQYERLIAELEKLRLKRAELKAQQDAEDAKSKTKKETTEKQSDKDLEEFDPLSKFKINADELQSFADQMEQSIVPLSAILKDAFLQVADAIGSVVEQWVLLGETGPGVMRKILAVALASIAKEAAINAIKELALGFAMLFLNPADSAAHFASAALWGSIAGGAALLGRKTAGNLFQQGGGAGRTSAGAGEREREPNNRTFNGSGPAPVESSSRASQDGSGGGFFGRVFEEINQVRQEVAESNSLFMRESAQRERVMLAVVERNTQTFSQFGVEGHGVVVKKGAGEASAEIAGAVVTHSNSSHDFNEQMLRNMNLG